MTNNTIIFKYLAVFFLGIVETFLYTCYLIRVQRKQPFISSLFMMIYIFIYLAIITYAIKNVETIPLILIYAFSCGIGNWIRMKLEKKNMNKIKFFQDKVLELSGKLKIKRPYIRQDNRLGGYIASLESGVHVITEKKHHFLTYNGKILKKLSKQMIIHSILHEFGHIKTDAKSIIEREYKAEKFALKAIKKYFPKYYNPSIKYIKQFINSGIKIYDKAFSKLVKEIDG